MNIEDEIAKPTAAASEMHMALQMPRILWGGTTAMRAAGITYLPQEVAESDASYQVKLKRAVLFNAFAKTVKGMAGRVFAKEIKLESDVPAAVAGWCENIDMTGRHLNVFARDVFQEALIAGVTHVLIDTPKASGEQTIAEATETGARPYAVHIRADDIIGWRSELIAGSEKLTQLRFYESVTVPDGPFAVATIQQIRVLSLGSYEIWRKNDKGKWALFEEGSRGVLDIPLVSIYSNRTGFMTAKPPLQDLCDLNVAHWQSSADQRNIVHVVRVPLLFGAGLPADISIVLGGGSITTCTDAGSSLQYVEHSGAGVGAGREDLRDLELQMEAMGLQLLVPRPGQTATGEVRDDIKETSQLAAIAMALKDGIEAVLGWMAILGGQGQDGGSITINTELGVASRTASDLQQLIDLVKAGLVSRRTLWAEMSRRGVLSDAFDPETEAEEVVNDLTSGVIPDEQA